MWIWLTVARDPRATQLDRRVVVNMGQVFMIDQWFGGGSTLYIALGNGETTLHVRESPDTLCQRLSIGPDSQQFNTND